MAMAILIGLANNHSNTVSILLKLVTAHLHRVQHHLEGAIHIQSRQEISMAMAT